MNSSWHPAGQPMMAPYLVVQGADSTIEFLTQLLGARVLCRHLTPEGRVQHAEVLISDSLVMLADAAPGWQAREAHVHVYVPDVEARYRRAIELGAESVQEPHRGNDPNRRGAVRDAGGTVWWISTHEGSEATFDLAANVRTVMDFPRPGIAFKDITPILSDPRAFSACIRQLAERVDAANLDAVAGIESRGFLFGAPLALELGKPFLPLRKPGKLPWKSRRVEYALEYGSDALEIHEDACAPGQKILLLDDLLATGGTVLAAAELVRGLGATVQSALFVIELGFLPGRQRLEAAGVPVESLLCYTGEED